MSLKLETMRAACRGEQDMRCRSLNERACSGVALGNIRFVNSCRKAGLSCPQPSSINLIWASKAVELVSASGSRRSGPARERAEQHEVADALGMARGVGDRDRAALRDAEQREPVELGGVDDGLEIRDQDVERGVGRVAVRQAAAARVVAMEAVALAERVEPGTPHRRLPVDVDVGQPVGGPDERIARRRAPRTPAACRRRSG